MPSPLEGTRLKILDILQREGSATVDQLSQGIGLASATIRRHLDILQRDHLVSFEQMRKRLGRPEFVYSLTEEGYEAGFRDYRKLLQHVLAEVANLEPSDLEEVSGPELLHALMTKTSRSMTDHHLASSDSSWEERLARLERALDEEGFSPELTPQNSHVEIRLWNCPFRATALRQESVCTFDHQLITRVMGVQPVRQFTIHDGSMNCSYLVAPPE